MLANQKAKKTNEFGSDPNSFVFLGNQKAGVAYFLAASGFRLP